MLGDISGLEKIYIVCGYTDMRKSIDGLCAVIEDQLKMDPSSSALFLFCGRRRDRIKALFREGLSAAFCYPHISSFYTKICSFPWKKYADKNYLSPQMRASSSSSSGHS